MASCLSLEKVKYINQRYKDSVFGYIRKCQTLLPSDIAYYQIPELVQHIILLSFYNTLDSKILTDTECDTLLKLFDDNKKFEDLGHFSYKRIYSSAKDGKGEKIFKERCHDQKNILCLIESTNGNVFGGYTSHGWIGSENGVGHTDPKAFILSIRSNVGNDPAIFNAKPKENALWNEKQFFCIFGGSIAFYINQDGETGGSFLSSNFQPFPDGKRHYLIDASFSVCNIEVFQLQT